MTRLEEQDMADQILNKSKLLNAFEELGKKAWARGKTIEISVYGGSALMLSFDWRAATRDVDAVYEADKILIHELAAEVAEDFGWDPDWLNDGVKGFLSARDSDEGQKLSFGEFPSPNQPGLRVFVPHPEYMFAMKCRAMRLGGNEENSDIEDIRNLAVELGISSAEEALDIVSSFYPASQLQPKVRFGLEEIFDALPRSNDTP
jgi:hypothetical protein